MKKQVVAFLTVFCMMMSACKKENHKEIDTDYPVIDLTAETAFPKPCSLLQRGETFRFRVRLSDNVALGSLSVDVHHNFDNHSHGTETESCGPVQVKTPVKPYLLIKSYDLPVGLRTYEMEDEILIPADVDSGDYHFTIKLTDQEGWQTIKRFSVKIQ